MWLLCSFQGPSERATRAYAGTMAGDGRRGLSKLNSMHGLELGVVPRTARGGAAGRVSGATAGPARSGRHARPHGRSANPA
jgi:hypothetical protein